MELEWKGNNNSAHRVQSVNPRDGFLCNESVTMKLSFKSALQRRTSSSCIWKYAWASVRVMHQWLIEDYSPDGDSVNSYCWFRNITSYLHCWLLKTGGSCTISSEGILQQWQGGETAINVKWLTDSSNLAEGCPIIRVFHEPRSHRETCSSCAREQTLPGRSEWLRGVLRAGSRSIGSLNGPHSETPLISVSGLQPDKWIHRQNDTANVSSCSEKFLFGWRQVHAAAWHGKTSTAVFSWLQPPGLFFSFLVFLFFL